MNVCEGAEHLSKFTLLTGKKPPTRSLKIPYDKKHTTNKIYEMNKTRGAK